MRKFDPWPVFFRREFNRNWPFLVGFAITGAVLVKFTAGLTKEDAKNSRFVQEHNRFGFISKPSFSLSFF
ncbi:putative ATP synthase 6 kDa subunit, mitochondrial [Cocos nucifera]|uniref:Putative ATP synthase 6 kDa subunit, mitochondrial n=1 Tax=Cocos nucifera TaxID=13894 RepID=A0A8K0ITK5_COCNU|nr:putative ATP synthase 6 kDa subunit, mitochondrial [Cocos nucifera]